MQCTMWDQYSLSLSPQQPRESPCCPHNPKSCSATTFSGRGFPRILPWYIHTQEHLPVIPAAVTVGVPEHLRDREEAHHIWYITSHPVSPCAVGYAHLAFLLQSLPLLSVDVPFNARFPTGNEGSVPQREGTQGQCN